MLSNKEYTLVKYIHGFMLCFQLLCFLRLSPVIDVII